ncbi:Prevent-host-death protein [methanotrophic bacterial endosymbiont of Bathymodiolus sp.]|jgi:prevent-host-death family protein|nr:Prevent-host-death protein [methanotrophic bacterial endosymbiont of Bathymodiolus sp.]
MQNNVWQLQDAKSKFSQLVESAMLNKPQFVTKHGHNAVVVLSFEDYKKITKPKIDLVAFLKNSPLAEIELDILRNGELPRDIDL